MSNLRVKTATNFPLKKLEVTKEAKKWRDLTQSERKKERNERIAILALGVCVLVMMILAATAIVMVAQWAPLSDGGAAMRLNGLAIGLAATGVVVLSISIIAALCLNKDKLLHGIDPRVYQSRRSETEYEMSEYQLLTDENGTRTSLDEAYVHFYGRTQGKNGGGLRPAVRAGMITVDEANDMRTLFRDYGSNIVPTLKKNEHDLRPDTQRGYDSSEHTKLQQQWRDMQQNMAIKNQNPDFQGATLEESSED